MPTNALRSPADLIAAAPGLLGFAPTNSIVVYLLRRHATHGLVVRCAVRFDVTISTAQAESFPATCNLRAADNDAAILLAVCEQRHDPHARIILNALHAALQAAGITVLRRLYTRDVTEAGEWLDADTGDYGDTYPYTDSLLTAELVHRGDRVSPSRADIEAEFAALPPAPPVEVGDHGQLIHRTCEEIAETLAGTRTPSPTLATRAGILITGHAALRDAMLGLAIDHPQAAADLWTHIARQLRGQPRAEALTVAAACFCLVGDTVRAGIATDAALQEAEHTHTPAPRLAVLLLAALQSGIPPTEIRRVIADSAPAPRDDQ